MKRVLAAGWLAPTSARMTHLTRDGKRVRVIALPRDGSTPASLRDSLFLIHGSKRTR